MLGLIASVWGALSGVPDYLWIPLGLIVSILLILLAHLVLWLCENTSSPQVVADHSMKHARTVNETNDSACAASAVDVARLSNVTVERLVATRNAGFSQIWLPARSHIGYPYLRMAWVGMPKIPTPYLKCTFYLYRNKEDALVGSNLGGTGFFVGLPSEVEPGRLYMIAVSNWHNMCKRAYPVIRVNTIGGGVDVFDLQPDEWQFVPGGHDIAAVLVKLDESVHDVTAVDIKDFLTEERLTELEIGPGENVFMAGRFIDHDGRGTNKPALRFGHISMMPEFIMQHNGARQPTYCVDVHSRTGFSGSPVFAFRTFGEDLSKPNVLDLNREKLFVGLLGIHWGQFPEDWKISKEKSVSKTEARGLVTDGLVVKGLSGMTCVAPVGGITEVINRTEIRNQIERSERDIERRRESGQIPTIPIAE